jgi:hypothetical protein
MLLRLMVLGIAFILSCSPTHASESCDTGSHITLTGRTMRTFENQNGGFTISVALRELSPCPVFVVVMSFAPPKECFTVGNWFIASGTLQEGAMIDDLHAESVRCQPDKPAQAVIPKIASPSDPGRLGPSNDKPVTHDQGHWFVIAGAWPSTENNKLKARMSLLSGNNITARVIVTDEYENLTPGLRAVVVGPTSREQAETQLDSIKQIVPDAYMKEGF